MKANIVLKDVHGSDLKGIVAMICDFGYGENIEKFILEDQDKTDGPVLRISDQCARSVSAQCSKPSR